MTFEEWLLTKDGKMCADFSTLKPGEYLKNRLWWAYQAGLNATLTSSEFANSEQASSTAGEKP